MKTKDLMTKNPEFCLPNDTAYTATRKMKRRNCGVIPIVRDRQTKRLEGILTDRDIALHLGKVNKPAKKVYLRDFPKNRVKLAHPEDSLRQVTKILGKSHLHRLPVVNKQRQLEGIISLKDLAVEAYKERRKKTRSINEKDVAQIVESISRSRSRK